MSIEQTIQAVCYNNSEVFWMRLRALGVNIEYPQVTPQGVLQAINQVSNEYTQKVKLLADALNVPITSGYYSEELNTLAAKYGSVGNYVLTLAASSIPVNAASNAQNKELTPEVPTPNPNMIFPMWVHYTFYFVGIGTCLFFVYNLFKNIFKSS